MGHDENRFEEFKTALVAYTKAERVHQVEYDVFVAQLNETAVPPYKEGEILPILEKLQADNKIMYSAEEKSIYIMN